MTDAILITGGYDYDTDALYTAELYLRSSGLSCSLASLPEGRMQHSMESSGLLCGGFLTMDTCLQWRSDAWEESLTLDVEREGHVSWTPGAGSGTFLMGGAASERTTTLITTDGTQEPGFPLKYDTL